MLLVRFPFGGFELEIEELAEDLRCEYGTKTGRSLSVLRVFLTDPSNLKVKVDGFGMPFSNPEHASDDWVNRHMPILSGFTIADILALEEFRFVVSEPSKSLSGKMDLNLLAPPFRHKYGSNFHWDEAGYEALLKSNLGQKFQRLWKFDNIEACLTVLTQSQVQDVMWLEWAAAEMVKFTFPAYFIDNPKRKQDYFVVVRLKNNFTDTFNSPWRRFSESKFDLLVPAPGVTDQDANEVKFTARLVTNWQGFDLLANDHQIEPEKEHEVILHVTRTSQQEEDQKWHPTVFSRRSDALTNGEEQ